MFLQSIFKVMYPGICFFASNIFLLDEISTKINENLEYWRKHFDELVG